VGLAYDVYAIKSMKPKQKYYQLMQTCKVRRLLTACNKCILIIYSKPAIKETYAVGHSRQTLKNRENTWV